MCGYGIGLSLCGVGLSLCGVGLSLCDIGFSLCGIQINTKGIGLGCGSGILSLRMWYGIKSWERVCRMWYWNESEYVDVVLDWVWDSIGISLCRDIMDALFLYSSYYQVSRCLNEMLLSYCLTQDIY